MSNQLLYRNFPIFLRQYFPYKVQKISINAGFTCPNRDGTKGFGGCTFCNNQTFNPEYCKTEKSVTEQIKEGKNFFAHKYPEMRYLAYFQAYTNTYCELEELKQKYEEALAIENVVGLVIGTRPDCMPEELLNYLAELNKRTFLMVEYGLESIYDETLKRINRGHTFNESVDAIQRTAERGILVGGHLILGLPCESKEMLIETAKCLSELPLNTLKLHQLQIIKGTKMALDYEAHPSDYYLYSNVDEYVDVVIDFMEHLKNDIVVERFVSQSPQHLLIAPQWGMKNYQIVNLVEKRMRERSTYQGKKTTHLMK